MVAAKSRVQLWHTSTCYSSNRIWFCRNSVLSKTNNTHPKKRQRTITNAVLLFSLLFSAPLLACIDIDLGCQFISENDEKSCSWKNAKKRCNRKHFPFDSLYFRSVDLFIYQKYLWLTEESVAFSKSSRGDELFLMLI